MNHPVLLFEWSILPSVSTTGFNLQWSVCLVRLVRLAVFGLHRPSCHQSMLRQSCSDCYRRKGDLLLSAMSAAILLERLISAIKTLNFLEAEDQNSEMII